MKSLISFFVLLIVGGEVRAQSTPEVNAATLVKITETADFYRLEKLIQAIEYIVLDSTKNKDGSFFYFTKESKFHGHLIGCYADENAKIKEMTFTTYNKTMYHDMKEQIKKLGFKSNGLNKGGKISPELLETEDFEKGKIFVATSIHKFDDGRIEHEFTFFKW